MTMRIGGHVSAAGGLSNAVLKAKEIGANTIQLFVSSPRQWRTYAHKPEEIRKFRDGVKKEGIDPVFIHAPYLINLASPAPNIRKLSRDLLAANLEIGEKIGAKGVIFHLGSGAEMDKSHAVQAVAESMREILKEILGRCMLLVENSAGGGRRIGATLEDLDAILRAVDSRRAGVCFDTAHAFEAGTILKYGKAEVDGLAEAIKETFGWENMHALHVNDSRTPQGSHHDMHENIGEGHIGLAGFKTLIAHKEFRKLPWLLEVPGFGEEKGPDRKNVDILKKLAG